MADDSVIVRFGGSIENLTAAVDSARGSIESLAKPFTGLTSALGAFGEAFAAAFAVREVAHFAESMAALAVETGRASQILGVSTEEVGALKLVAEASGGSLEELQTAFGKLSRNVIDESPNAKRALDALGLSFADIRNKTPIQQIELLATKFAGIKDGADKDAIAIELLGRAGENLIPIFNQGAGGIAKWAATLKELEPAYARAAAAAGARLDESIIEMNAAIDGMKQEAFVDLAKDLSAVVMVIRDFGAGWTEWTEASRKAGEQLGLLGHISQNAATVFARLANGIRIGAATMNEAGVAASVVWQHAGGLIGDSFTSIGKAAEENFPLVMKAGEAAAQGIEAAFTFLETQTIQVLADVRDIALEDFAAIRGGLSSIVPVDLSVCSETS
ncbi:MAG: hypothetical protein WBE80_06125 [Methylocella sp.]